MTEEQWLACADSTPMVDFVQTSGNPRKLRLFLVACARQLWDLIPDGEARRAVEVAEGYADGLASEDERDRIAKQLWSPPHAGEAAGNYAVANSSGATPQQLEDRVDEHWAYLCALLTVHRPGAQRVTSRATWEVARRATGSKQPGLLRDIFGNPFRPATFAPEWRTGTVVALAAQMYETRDFSPMPILADALMDAGCNNNDILEHCRSGDAHVRGCWVVDLVLGKS